RRRWIKSYEEITGEIEKKFTYPVFIKPVNMGSSLGISKAHNRQELISGIDMAANYDWKILVEEFVDCREIECAVLGNEAPEASVLGEILPSEEFYDYNAKYFDGGKSRLLIPAPIDEKVSEQIRNWAALAFESIGGSGLARVDFFLEKSTGQVYINEINTLPGFTNISMYPQLWEHSGIPYSNLIDRLIELATEKFKECH
ncbi:MAG: D-alanine--D-alanine ligase, partial [Clostridia bacterium]